MSKPIVADVKQYLAATDSQYEQGTPLYYARLALEQALESYEAGDYGIGAVVVVRRGDDLFEYRARNRMVTNQKGGIVDHAETRGMLAVVAGDAPDASYEATSTAVLGYDGAVVFGTLEPCPMCASVMTNGGVRRSFSTVADGELVTTPDGYRVSDGGATVLGGKYFAQPQVWQAIQRGRGLTFGLVDTAADPDLRVLSERIFTETRADIDALLAARKPPVS